MPETALPTLIRGVLEQLPADGRWKRSRADRWLKMMAIRETVLVAPTKSQATYPPGKWGCVARGPSIFHVDLRAFSGGETGCKAVVRAVCRASVVTVRVPAQITKAQCTISESVIELHGGVIDLACVVGMVGVVLRALAGVRVGVRDSDALPWTRHHPRGTTKSSSQSTSPALISLARVTVPIVGEIVARTGFGSAVNVVPTYRNL